MLSTYDNKYINNSPDSGVSGTDGDVSNIRILVAEDDAAIRELLVHHLTRDGFTPLEASDGPTALRVLREGVDLALLDIGLPGVDGFDVARTMRRENRTTPLVMLTARAEEIDRVVGFELGADDYVVKPFSPREVVARVRAVLRRSGMKHEAGPAVLRFGRLEIDAGAREVRVDGRDVGLKPREYGLLSALAGSAGIALSRDTLLERVWGYDFDGDERTVDVHVRRLRMKLEEEHGLEPCLHTVHGFGYKFARA
ncbi:MAG: response regulator transcription factor [Candidatus Eremiobacteraeota bacterium]|nr:response regulator transcription factor [Candidatus Eremiobacteraeota bacterium]